MSGSEMIIRQYATEDETAVIELWQRCNLTKPWNNPKLDIERKLKVNPELFLVGVVQNRITATVMGGYDGHRGWIYYLAVDPEHQRKGLGRQIMTSVEKKLLATGCPKIDLMVRQGNTQVIEFYNRIGYGHDEVITLSKRLIEDKSVKGFKDAM